MAPKSQTRLVDQPPSASSSEDEEESDPEEETQNSEEESEEEDEEEEEQTPVKAPEQAPKKAPEQPPKKAPSSPLSSKKPTVQKPQSSSGSESESDEEGSDSSQHTQPSPSVSDFAIKPSLPSNAPPASKPLAKRPPETPVRDSARKKLKSGEEDGNAEEKKLPGSASAGFARVWSEDDEIAVLEGMIDYKNQKGTDPSADLSAFHEFIKGKLQADISRTQMYEKIRRLRKKFFTNIERGDAPDFSKPHDYKTFEVSKKVWGNSAVSNGVNENTKSPNVKAKKAAEIKKTSEPKKGAKASNLFGITKEEPKKGAKVSDFGVTKEEEKEKPIITKEKDTGISLKDEGDFKSKYPRLVESFNKANMPKLSEQALAIIQENLSLIGSSKAEEFEEQWTEILKEEAELFLKMTDLMGEQIKLIVETIKK